MSDKPMVFNYQKYKEMLERSRWIPCSEMLPEENVLVLVSVKKKGGLPEWQTYHYVTDIDVWDTDAGGWYGNKSKVVAWMPLPDPYKGGDSE